MQIFLIRSIFSRKGNRNHLPTLLLLTAIFLLLLSRLPDFWLDNAQATDTEISHVQGTGTMRDTVEGILVFLSLGLIGYSIYLTGRQQKDRRRLFSLLEEGKKEYLLDSAEKPATEEEIVNNLLSSLKEATSFVSEISKGNYEVSLGDINSGKNTHNLAGTLLKMKEMTLQASIDEDKRRWTNEGIARFADLLRSDQSLQALSDQLLREIVKYMGANQGALFLVNDEQPERVFMELKSCYAYNRKKYVNREIEIGEGLIGQVYLEKDYIYLTDIPQDYVQITSGLGDANPRSILLVPLISNDKINGVIELASFKEFQEHEIIFCRKIAETISSTLSTFRINERTRFLLEESQQQAEEMRAQEEEMRQNMEELEATQEEMERVGTEMSGQLSAINNTMATIEFDLEGNILTANDNFLQLMGYDLNSIRGKHHRIFVENQEAQSDNYKSFWKKLASGESEIGEFKRVSRSGKQVYIKGIYNPIADRSGTPKKILKIAYDITESREMELLISQQLEEARQQEEILRQNMEEMTATQEELAAKLQENEKMKKDLDAYLKALDGAALMSESDIYGNIINVNDRFCEVTQYSREEVIGKPHSILRHSDNPKELFKEMWDTIKAGQVFKGRYPNRAKDGSTYWVDATIEPVLGENGKPEKYIGIRFDITEQVAHEEEIKQLMEELDGNMWNMKMKEEELQQKIEELENSLTSIEEDQEEVRK